MACCPHSSQRGHKDPKAAAHTLAKLELTQEVIDEFSRLATDEERKRFRPEPNANGDAVKRGRGAARGRGQGRGNFRQPARP